MKQISATPYYVWAGLFIIVPIIYVLYYTFTDGSGQFVFFENFNLHFWYFHDRFILSEILRVRMINLLA